MDLSTADSHKLPPEFEDPEEMNDNSDKNECFETRSSGEPSENSNKIVITKEMEEEEHLLEKRAIQEEQELMKKMQGDEKKIQEEQCFKRLHLLLSRSSLYAKFIGDKIKRHESIQKKISGRQHTKVNKSTSSGKHSVKRKAKESAVRKKQKLDENIVSVFNKKNMREMEFDQDERDSLDTSKDEAAVCNQPDLLCGGTMRSYQLEGYEWLKTLFENGVNGILADEMGLGKTIQCIAFIAHLIEMQVPGPFFICGPLSTVPNWYAEFKRFTPDIPVIVYHGGKADRQEMRKIIGKKVKRNSVNCCPVVLTSYQVALIDAPKLHNIQWKMLVIDEAHRIKNFQCKLVRALKTFNAVHRLLLTGTPLQNNLSELWSLLNFILPEIFDDLEVFESWFDIDSLVKSNATQEIIAREQEKQIVSTIHQILTPFLLRRTKLDVELDLPPKKEVIVHAPLTKIQQEYYVSTLNKSIHTFFNGKGKLEKEIDEVSQKRISKKTTYFGCAAYDTSDSENNESDETSVSESTASAEVSILESNASGEVSILESNMPNGSGVLPNLESKIPERSEIKTPLAEIHLSLRNILMCLRKICCHPYLISYPLDPHTNEYLIDENLVKSSGKFLVLDALLPELIRRGHKVLLFSQFVSFLNILEDYCTLRKYKYCKLYGSSSLEERQEELKVFSDDKEIFIFLISTRAGGLGINVVAADTAIFMDSDWNPQSDLQAQDRCHRIGQTKPVVVYRLITPNTIDERIYNRAITKRKLEKAIMQKGRFKSKDNIGKEQLAITKEELLELLESSDVKGFVKTDDNHVLSRSELETILDRSDMVPKV